MNIKWFTGLILLLLFIVPSSAFNNNIPAKIQVGDLLSIHAVDGNKSDLILGEIVQPVSVIGDDPHDFRVSNSGYIYLLNIGPIKVSGKTTAEVENIILDKFKDYEEGVWASVLLKTIRTNRIYVLGEVINPGLYELPRYDDTKNKLMNVINIAGGFTTRADKTRIDIVRNDRVAFKANLYKLIVNNDLSQNTTLRDKDTIIVKQAVSRVYVLGQVNKPGGVSYMPGSGFMDYIAEAGGFNNDADLRNIGIARLLDGKLAVNKVSVDLINSSDLLMTAAIKQGDIIYIPKHFFADWKDLHSLLNIALRGMEVNDRIQGRSTLWN
ncbi:SLBB domain-containing protein [Candidatus Margulisiibacteriota bacterium]